MGTQGYIAAFTETEVAHPAELVRRTGVVLGISAAVEVMRSVGEDRSWSKRKRVGGRRPVEIATSATEMHILGYSKSMEDVARSVAPGTCLRAALDNPAWEDIDRALRAEIPEGIRGQFVPNGLILRVGWHDLFEVIEHDDGHLFGRAWYSLSFFGPGSPNDWKEYRRTVVETSVVRSTFAAVEAITGPLRRCVYWT